MDLFDLIRIFHKNILMFGIIGIISIAIGLSFIYLLPTKNNSSFNTTIINVLIEDNEIINHKSIIETANRRLASAYNYEKWSDNNLDISKNYKQSEALALIIDQTNATLIKVFNSEKEKEAAISYLDFTTKVVNNKIVTALSKGLESQLKIEKQKQNLFLITEENEIIKTELEINTAIDELKYIKHNLSDKVQSLPEIILHVLSLNKEIKVNKTKIERLLVRKDQSQFAPKQFEVNQKLSYLNNQLMSFINSHITKDEMQTTPELNLNILELINAIESTQSTDMQSETDIASLEKQLLA